MKYVFFSIFLVKLQSTEKAAHLPIFSILISPDSPNKRSCKYGFWRAYGNTWKIVFSWQMTSKVGLSKPPCLVRQKRLEIWTKKIWFSHFIRYITKHDYDYSSKCVRLKYKLFWRPWHSTALGCVEPQSRKLSHLEQCCTAGSHYCCMAQDSLNGDQLTAHFEVHLEKHA